MGRRLAAPDAEEGALFLALFGDDRLHRGDRAVGDLDLDHVGADLADRLLEADVAAVDAQVAGLADRGVAGAASLRGIR